MKKNVISFAVVCLAVLTTYALSGCGSSPTSQQQPAAATVSGVAATGKPIAGTAYLKDSAATERSTQISADGSFSFFVQGLTPPFMLKAEWSEQGATHALHSFANGPGRANINPLSHVAVAAAGNANPSSLYHYPTASDMQRIAGNLSTVITDLRTSLKPLLDAYNAHGDPVTGPFAADGTGLDAVFDDAVIVISGTNVLCTNRLTGGTIFSAPMNNIKGGTFTPGNMPMPQGPIDGAALYGSKCAGCHGPLATSTVKGTTAEQTQTAINNNRGGMGFLATLTTSEITAIATALAVTTPPPPSACTYTYSSWGVCQSNNMQTRTVLSSSPAGCTGTPVLTQTCTYVPPPPVACVYNYSTWGACQPDNTQTRTVTSSSPAGCTGTPVLTQTCTYVPPTPTCGTCHAIPPATGKHAFHASRATCASCHGSGYSTTTVNTAIHADGVKNIAGSAGWNATSRTCANSCHGSKGW